MSLGDQSSFSQFQRTKTKRKNKPDRYCTFLPTGRRRMVKMLEALMLVTCISIFNPISVNGATNPADVSALKVLYEFLGLPHQLTNWTENIEDACGKKLLGIVCDGSSVTELHLPNLQLSGTLGYLLSNLSSLKILDVSQNNLTGPISYQLPPNTVILNLAGNRFRENIPYSVSQMSSLQYLNVSGNQLTGQLDIFGNLTNLSKLDLSFNNFTSYLPQSFSKLSRLKEMYLQNNDFYGTIDILSNLSLEILNVSYNNFTGTIPAQLRNIILSDGNPWSTGPAPPLPPTPPSSSRSSLGGGAIAGIVIAIIFAIVVFSFFLLKRKRKKSFYEEKLNLERSYTAPLASNEANEFKCIETSFIERKTLETSNSFGLMPPPMDRNKSFDEDEFSNKPVIKQAIIAPIGARLYSIAELQIATGSFCVENFIGEGSVGRVYKAQFDDGKVMAVKKVDVSGLPNQTSEVFLEVVSIISNLHHPNVTNLAGYCYEHEQYLLVYDFHKNGSLHDFLHLMDEYRRPLTWNTRIKIALGTARALEYLHELCSPSIVHKNINSANIFLDDELNPRLSDIGLASFLPNAKQVLTQGRGSGYGAPEVVMSGQYSLKSDVYSFGVVMLELLTGRKPLDSLKPRYEQSLVRWATPQLHDIDALAKMVDPALRGLYPPKSLSRFADIVALCVQPEPEFRPPMSEVVEALVRLVQRAMSKRTAGEFIHEEH